MEILLSLLQENDAEELLEFEMGNRRFFEKMVPGRGDDYYQWETFLQRHRELLEEQESGICRFYLMALLSFIVDIFLNRKSIDL